jgi:signal recognition particle subunit SRP54
MLDILSSGFRKASESLRGKATITEENIADAMAAIRQSLLEADVEYGVAKKFLANVKEKALGENVTLKAGQGSDRRRVGVGDHFVAICKTELESLMGEGESELHLPSGVAKVMLVGLQGAGKTTTAGKLAKFLKENKKRHPLLVAADIYRPAAMEQLRVLGEKLNVPVFIKEGASAQEICAQAVGYAKERGLDTLILDTAGRLTIDAALMSELQDIKREQRPDHILLVCDSMMGQDAVTTAKSFDASLDLSGVIMTKLDGDARGGAALSIKSVTGKPIKFVGMGEGMDRLEVFRPEGLASRILGMGDVVGLMQDFERVADRDQEQDAMRMLQGKFNFNDFYSQIATIQKMGSLKDVVEKLPMQNLIPKDAKVDDNELVKIKSMIDSMTQKERLAPDVINPSRARRIAKGSGRAPQDVSDLVKKFMAMRNMMSMLGQNMGLLGKIPGMNQLAQMNNMRKMMQGGAGGMADLMGSMGMGGMGGMGMGMGGGEPAFKRVDRDKVKKARKAARKNRKR